MELSSNGIKSVSGGTWKRYCSYIQRLEAQFWKTDRFVKGTIENMNFDVGSESETDTASENSSIDWESDTSNNVYFNK